MENKDENIDIYEGRLNPLRIILSAWLQILEVSIFILVALLAILSISEISARQSFLAMLQNDINRLQTEFVDQNKSTTISQQENAASDRIIQENQLEQSYFTIKKIAYDRELLNNVKSLVTIGAEDSNQTLRSIRKKFTGTESRESDTKQLFYYTSGIISKLFDFLGLNVNRMSSDHLLAIAVMTCGAIGALVAGMRQKQPMTLRNLTLGLSTGFIVYLGIRGGKSVFLLQSSGEPIPFNPYGSAFAGLLAGLFTERAYRFLTNLVDQVIKRVESAVKG